VALRTTVVGSWWPLPGYEQDLRRYHRGELGAEEGEALLDRCAEEAIRQQRELGLTEWTGGEYFTKDFILHLAKRLTGIEIIDPGPEVVFDYDDMAKARIVGEMAAPHGLGYAARYQRESRLPGGVPMAAVVSPLEVSQNERMAGETDRLEAQMGTLTSIVNEEIKAIAAAGCPHIQLDAPVIGGLVNNGLMTADEGAAAIAACFEGVGDVKRGVHFCNGNLRGRPISGVLRCAPWVEILQRLEGVIDIVHIECSYFPQYLEREAYRDLPESMELAAGIVDEANYWVEPVSKIRERAADWARVVGEERLWIAPCCGFGRHPSRDIPVLRAKIENMVEAAARL
jgi:5-methyltetrahydropteroyltriglutamate--homocysteine methyltransferase